MYGRFEYTTELQYQVKSLQSQVNGFKSGEKYRKMREEFRTQLAEKDREIKRLKCGLGNANAREVSVRNNYQQVIEDLEDEYKKKFEKQDRVIQALGKELLETQIMLDAAEEKCRDKIRELYQAKTDLEEEKGKNQALRAQINRDHENSSSPSSAKPKRKKITNNRERTGKSPGGQPGHEGHPRKKHEPTKKIDIPPPEKYAVSPDYKPTGKTITKQHVDIRMELIVTEYNTPEFRNVHTGQRVHADFPDGLVNEVTYSGNIKSFLFLLNNRCNVAIAKVSDFLAELTGGRLKISTGMINALAKEFSSKTESEQKKSFADLLLSPVMNTDFTSARVNGTNVNVAVCATPETVLYFAREHKSHEGIKGTPVETYQGILVNDHDKTFYNYGNDHQECLGHPLRYLVATGENEPDRKWVKLMWELIREMIHFKNSLDEGDKRNPDEIDPVRVAELENRYDKILVLAKEEYEYEPPTKYCRGGFNLYKKLFDYRDNHLLFLHDRKVPTTNDLAERLLRIFKRKQHQVMAFRSWDGLLYWCNSMGTIASLCAQNQNLYESVSSIFDRKRLRC